MQLSPFYFSSLNLCLFFSLSPQHPPPPLLFSTSDHCPRHVKEEPAGSLQSERFPKCFPFIAFVESIIYNLSLLSVFPSSLLFFSVSFLAASIHRQFASAPEAVLFLISFHIFFFFYINAWMSVYLLLNMSSCSSSSPLSFQADTQTHTISPLFTHVHKHISYLTSTRCLKMQTPLNFCQCLHVSSVSSNVNAS